MPATKYDENLIRKLAKVLEETGLSEIEIENEGARVRVARQIGISAATIPAAATAGSAPFAAQTQPAPVIAVNLADHPGALKSPMVGTAYGASAPGAPAFIKLGDKVNKGQTLLIIEAMKVMNPIVAEKPGTVKDIAFKDGQPVEFGEVLVVIE